VALPHATHPGCVVCGHNHPHGLRLDFTLQDDGSVETVFAASEAFEGYQGRLHGGIIAAILDGAMTHCLFAHGRRAFTAELTVRYRLPVMTSEVLVAHAGLVRVWNRLYHLAAELRVAGQIRATASAKFLEAPVSAPPDAGGGADARAG
jgi:acyl-coenzyme A thioesterase PaaI-like protein